MREDAKLDLARQFHRTLAAAKKLLWKELRNRQLDGFEFVRQAPVGPFIVDFLCRNHPLIVEVDGATHASDDEIADDRRRSAKLEKRGHRVVRLPISEVLESMDLALKVIRLELADFPSPAASRLPLPQAGEAEKQPLPLAGEEDPAQPDQVRGSEGYLT